MTNGPVVEPEVHEKSHPGIWVYVKIALMLVVLTAAEVAVSYMHADKLPKTVALLVMMVVKFALVALFYMHLKFDSVGYRRVFILGISLAVIVYGVTILTFSFIGR